MVHQTCSCHTDDLSDAGALDTQNRSLIPEEIWAETFEFLHQKDSLTCRLVSKVK